jgi:hypothetical protein
MVTAANISYPSTIMLTPLLVLSSSINSYPTAFLRVFLGPPRFLAPWGSQCTIGFSMDLVDFLKVCSIKRHFLLSVCIQTGFRVAVCCKSSFCIVSRPEWVSTMNFRAMETIVVAAVIKSVWKIIYRFYWNICIWGYANNVTNP